MAGKGRSTTVALRFAIPGRREVTQHERGLMALSNKAMRGLMALSNRTNSYSIGTRKGKDICLSAGRGCHVRSGFNLRER